MSSFREIAKGGWHPKSKDGSEESWRSDFKGVNQVAGWMGKGKDTNNTSQHEHVSKPLSSLKNPASFGPPPKHVKYHGAAALPNETTPSRRGMGAPSSREQVDYQNTQQQQPAQVQPARVEMEEEQPSRPTPSVPYRADTTGLSTSHLPPPPTRRTDSPAGSGTTQTSRPKPSAPPRAPPRQSPPSTPPSLPPAYAAQPPSGHASEGHVNEQATSNLSRAGVSVPALGIDSKAGSARKAPPPPPPTRGPSRQQSFPNAPSRTATAPSTSSAGGGGFRERHGNHLEAGKQKVSGINEKYGISRRINNFVEDQKSPADQGPPPPQHPNRTMSHGEPEAPNRRKAPPPPPPKRQEMRASPVNAGPPPPPVPLGSKPR
ncbi:hypothetical protein PHISP_00156 [Aspergillus sp. HF37]|nr:hypothetical protein PHISP_00156 [Aspergillus sp. HF37]